MLFQLNQVDMLSKWMQQICSTREAGWFLFIWVYCEFRHQLQGREMQFNLLIFHVKKKRVDNTYIFLNKTYFFLISSVVENSTSWIQLHISVPWALCSVFHRTGLVEWSDIYILLAWWVGYLLGKQSPLKCMILRIWKQKCFAISVQIEKNTH